MFYLFSLNSGYVSKDCIKPYDSEKIKIEAFKKYKNKKEFLIGIEEADTESKRLVIVDSNSVKINGVASTATSNTNLPSLDEELKMIKGHGQLKENQFVKNHSATSTNESACLNKRKVTQQTLI